MKYLLSGGHLTPAYALSQFVTAKEGNQVEVIGALSNDSVEATEFNKLSIPYHQIPTVKYDRYRPLFSLLRLPLIIVSIWRCRQLIRSIKPDIVIVFGGYVSVPLAIASYQLHIPCIQHEQTRSFGLANKLISKLVTATAYSYPNKNTNKPHSHAQVTGNLLRSEIWHPPEKPSFECTTDKPILFITGGNQGSKVIIKALLPLISKLIEKYQLIIQLGNVSLSQEQLPQEIIVKKWFSPFDISWILHHSHLVIGRAGANTVAEIAAIGVPAIFVPLPNTSENEQYKNARSLSDVDAAITIEQDQLTENKLLEAIETIDKRHHQFKLNALDQKQLESQQAVAKLVDLVNQVVANQ